MRLGKYNSHFEFTKKKCSNNRLQAATYKQFSTNHMAAENFNFIVRTLNWTSGIFKNDFILFKSLVSTFWHKRLADQIQVNVSASSFVERKLKKNCPKLGHQNERRHSKLIGQSKHVVTYWGRSRATHHLKELKLISFIIKMNRFEYKCHLKNL